MAPRMDFDHKSPLASLIEAVSDFIAGPQARWEDLPFAPATFKHGSHKEGLVATRDLEAGEQLISVPRALQVPSHEELGARRFLQIHAGPFYKSALVLAERHRLWLSGQGTGLGIGPQSAKVAEAQLQAWPTLQQLRAQGIPLLASPQELDALRELPGVDVIPKHVDSMKQALLRSLDEYMQDPDHNAQVTWEDVLWGAGIALSKLFRKASSDQAATLAPVADAISHTHSAEQTSNADWELTSDGPLHVRTTRHLHKGEELTLDYEPIGEFGALQSEGIVTPHDPKVSWQPSEVDCTKLRALLLGPENPVAPRRVGPLLNNIRDLAEDKCPSKVDANATEANIMQGLEAPRRAIHKATAAEDAEAGGQSRPRRGSARYPRGGRQVKHKVAASQRQLAEMDRAGGTESIPAKPSLAKFL